jgi:hypothetical protein
MSVSWIQPVMLMRRKGLVPTIILLNAPEFGGRGDPDQIVEKLISMGIDHYLIEPDFLDSLELELSPTTQKRREEFKEARKVIWRPWI